MPRARSSLRLALAGAVVLAVGPLTTSPVAAEEAGEGTVVGELVQAWAEERPEDDGKHEHAEPDLLTWVVPAQGEAVRVLTEDLPEAPGLTSGATVEVTVGDEVVDPPAEDGLDPAVELLDVDVLAAAPAVSPADPGTTNEVTVVMVRPGSAATDSRQLADVVAAVESAAAFWSEQSDGAIQLAVTAQHDWIETTADCTDDPFALWDEVAVAVGWAGGPGEHLLLYLPQTAPGCAYGLGTVGTGVDHGGLVYVTDVRTSLLAHEFGHNFSLGHASALQCDGSLEEDACARLPYGDLYDVMGYSWDQVGSLNTPHADRLGLLDPMTVQHFSVFTTERLESVYALDQTGVNGGVRLVDPIEDIWTGVSYWLEYRYPRGRDAWLGTTANRWGLDSGVLLHVTVEGEDSSMLLDGTPSPEADWDSDFQVALPVGTPVPVAGGAFVVTVESTSTMSASVRIQPGQPIRAAYERAGGTAGPLGRRSGDLRCWPDGGCSEDYEQGAVYWSPATGAYALLEDVLGVWSAFGGSGALGYPVADEVCGLRAGGCYQPFEAGAVVSSPATGVRATWGALWRRWEQLAGEGGVLGYPTGNPACGLRAGGCRQAFEGGSVYWSPTTGAQATWGLLRARWASYGSERGHLGYPARHPRCGLRAGGCGQAFQGGSVHWSPATGAHATWGLLRSRWSAGGAQAGLHGYPTTEPRCGLVRGGCHQRFQRGSIYWSPGSRAHSVGLRAPAIARAWAVRGGERGSLGYPVTGEMRRSDGYAQRFQGGTLIWNARTGAIRQV